jgi:hypothetical protein
MSHLNLNLCKRVGQTAGADTAELPIQTVADGGKLAKFKVLQA